MILREATIKYAGYDPDELSEFSKDKICISCDECGRVRWIRKDGYRSLCGSCAAKKRPTISDKTRKKMSKSRSGENNYFYGKKFNEEHKQKLRDNHWDSSGKNNPMYGKSEKDSPRFGMKNTLENRIFLSCRNREIPIEDFDGFVGRAPNREHVLPACDCIKMNDRFKGSHFHHITKSIGIYIPQELHRHINHSLKSGKNMGSINMLALQFINGGL